MNKLTKSFFGIALGASFCFAAVAFVGAAENSDNKEIKEVEAATNSVTLAGSFNGWNTSANPLTLNGDYWTIEQTFAVNDEFKIVVNGSDWVGDGAGVTWCDGIGSLGSGKNFQVTTAGKYLIKAVKTIGDYGDKSYGLVFEHTKISPTLQVKFTSAVPSYIDIFLPGSFNSWSTAVATSKMTRVNNTTFTYSLSNVTWGSYTYKVVACYDDVTVMNYSTCVDADNQNLDLAATDTGTVSLGNDRTYDFAANLPLLNPTLQVTFTSAVPDYADIYIPGTFNGWSQDISVSKMTRVNNTTFTYSLSGIYKGAFHQYKIVACYSTATEVDYAHEIDAGNQNVTINSNSVTLGDARTYDFAKDMPQQPVASGAHITLTFASEVPNSVNIIYVGALTNWGTTRARMEAGYMTRTSSTVYTWNIPSGTYTGDYQYKIVAMSMYTGATEVSYTDIVYGNKDTNEHMTLDSTTTNYPLTANNYDLSDLGAYAFSEGFTKDMETICGTTSEEWGNDHSGSSLTTKWSTWKTNFEGLTSGAKTAYGNNTSSDKIVQAKALYSHCVGRYGLSTWTGAPAAASRASLSFISEGSSTVLMTITIIASMSILTAGAYLFFKKSQKVGQ